MTYNLEDFIREVIARGVVATSKTSRVSLLALIKAQGEELKVYGIDMQLNSFT
jgi:hypothetical protein